MVMSVDYVGHGIQPTSMRRSNVFHWCGGAYVWKPGMTVQLSRWLTWERGEVETSEEMDLDGDDVGWLHGQLNMVP